MIKNCLPKLKASLTACFSSPSCRKLPSQASKTPAFAENFCSKPKRPATNQILLRAAKTSQDFGKTAKTACFQRILASQLRGITLHTPFRWEYHPFQLIIIAACSSTVCNHNQATTTTIVLHIQLLKTTTQPHAKLENNASLFVCTHQGANSFPTPERKHATQSETQVSNSSTHPVGHRRRYQFPLLIALPALAKVTPPVSATC